jgi:ATP-dependent Zn protease
MMYYLYNRGQALGMVAYIHKDETHQTKQSLYWLLDTCMGGRVSEELTFGPDAITTGSNR